MSEEEAYGGRRAQLVEELEGFRKAGWDRAGLDQESRRRYETTMKSLTDLDAVQAQKALLKSQSDLIEAQRASAAAQHAETTRLEEIRGRSDEQSYWFRRFLTSLTVAHGVGLATSINGLMKQPSPVVSSEGAIAILLCFGLGLILMGTLPIALAGIDPRQPDERKDRNRLQTAYVISAVCSFALALGVAGVGKIAFDTHASLRLAAAAAPAPGTSPPPAPSIR